MFGQQDTPVQPGNDMANGAVPPPSPSMINDMAGSTLPVGDPVDPMASPPSDPMPPMNDPVTPSLPDVSLPAPDPVAAPTESPAPDDSSPTPVASPPSEADNDNLMNIKQQALQQLSPLVGHLDQTPEEKFRTTMMMIQASDDSSLLPQAYEAANQIAEEKVKAQALLDVINEINYFTQHTAGK